ncbi:MAG: response regulator [Myxococcales bacterium]|jgi:two-component system chemotaxis response regulator CheY|nr:response regulator [Myxococcales bacterium]
MAKVMVVDDSATVRAQVSRALVQAGFEAVEATDGRDALQKVMGPEADSVLIVCDVNMPNMSGIEFLEAARSKGIAVPVLVLTTEGQPQMMRRAKAAGARAWIIKPFKADVLVAAAKHLARAA